MVSMIAVSQIDYEATPWHRKTPRYTRTRICLTLLQSAKNPYVPQTLSIYHYGVVLLATTLGIYSPIRPSRNQVLLRISTSLSVLWKILPSIVFHREAFVTRQSNALSMLHLQMVPTITRPQAVNPSLANHHLIHVLTQDGTNEFMDARTMLDWS